MSGIVEESPGKLEYEVALFREADGGGGGGGADGNLVLGNEVPVEQAVPIGTRLQLRASINSDSAWRYVKLTEVTVSSDPNDAYADGHIKLVEKGYVHTLHTKCSTNSVITTKEFAL